jgi:hydrogenase expression/formation protein HypC
MSRLQRVLAPSGAGWIQTQDREGRVHRVSLLALDGAPPGPGEWVVVHSGYAIDRADADDATAVAADLRSVTDPRGDRR